MPPPQHLDMPQGSPNQAFLVFRNAEQILAHQESETWPRTMIFSFEGYPVHYTLEGRGPSVLFLHGLGGNTDNWLHQRRFFARARQVLAIDLPGQGRSAGHDVPFRRYWEVVQAILDHAEIEDCDICGLSTGARAGVALASHSPRRVRRLVILNAFVTLRPSDRAQRIDLYRLLDRDDGGRMWAETLLQQMGVADHAAIVRGFFKSLETLDLKHIQRVFFDVVGYDQTADLPSIECPTLILHSENDKFIPDYCAGHIHRHIRNSTVNLIARCGHLPYLEDPKQFNDLLQEFSES